MSLKAVLSRYSQAPPLALAITLTSLIPVATQAADAAAPAVSLTWMPNPEANLAGYKLHFGSSSGNYSTVLDVGAVLKAPLPQMILGQTYYVALSAYDTNAREGPLSEELIVTASPPGPVTSPGFAGSSAGQGELQWSYPKVSNSPADHFTIQSSEDLVTWSPAGSITSAEAVNTDARWFHFRVPFATDKPRQFFRVGAVNAFGKSD